MGLIDFIIRKKNLDAGQNASLLLFIIYYNHKYL